METFHTLYCILLLHYFCLCKTVTFVIPGLESVFHFSLTSVMHRRVSQESEAKIKNERI